jgi:hypothetical protein
LPDRNVDEVYYALIGALQDLKVDIISSNPPNYISAEYTDARGTSDPMFFELDQNGANVAMKFKSRLSTKTSQQTIWLDQVQYTWNGALIRLYSDDDDEDPGQG